MDKDFEVYLNLIFDGVSAFAFLSVFTFCLARRAHGQWAGIGIVAGLLGLASFGVLFAGRAQLILADDAGILRKINQTDHLATVINGCSAGAVMLLVLSLAASHLDTLRV